MLRLDATTKKGTMENSSNSKKKCIEQAFFINDFFSSHVKASTHKLFRNKKIGSVKDIKLLTLSFKKCFENFQF